MQDRKIAVPIKTIDDKHCSRGCGFYYEGYSYSFCYLSAQGKKLATDKSGINYKKMSFLRTAECLKREIKEGK